MNPPFQYTPPLSLACNRMEYDAEKIVKVKLEGFTHLTVITMQKTAHHLGLIAALAVQSVQDCIKKVKVGECPEAEMDAIRRIEGVNVFLLSIKREHNRLTVSGGIQ